MPIDYTKMFFAKAGYMFVQQFYFMLVLLVPVLIEWGVMTSQTYSFYLMILPCVLLIPIVPFFLATILSIPTVKIMNLLEKRFVITFIMFAVLIGVGFYFLYRFVKAFDDLAKRRKLCINYDLGNGRQYPNICFFAIFGITFQKICYYLQTF